MIILLRLPLPADADPCVPYPTAGNSPPVTGGFGSVVDAAAERSSRGALDISYAVFYMEHGLAEIIRQEERLESNPTPI
jgi:hypothetical protein